MPQLTINQQQQIKQLELVRYARTLEEEIVTLETKLEYWMEEADQYRGVVQARLKDHIRHE